MPTTHHTEPTYDERTGGYTMQYNPAESGEIVSTIIHAVCSVGDMDPTQLSPTLYEVLDPDALEELVGSVGGRNRDSERNVGVWFEYADHLVVVHADGLIEIHPHLQSLGDGGPMSF